MGSGNGTQVASGIFFIFCSFMNYFLETDTATCEDMLGLRHGVA